jgi:hypothetical protein
MSSFSPDLYRRATEITTHDTADIPPTSAVYFGGPGNLKADLKMGGTVTFTAVPTGTILPICITRAYATGSTASGTLKLVALY